MKKILLSGVLVLLLLVSFSDSVEAKKKPRPTPTPTPTATPTPSPTPTPTPIPIGVSDIFVLVIAPSNVASNEPIRYDIIVTNNGPDTANDVQFCSKLNTGLALAGHEPGSWSLRYGSGDGRYADSDCDVWAWVSTIAPNTSEAMSYEIFVTGPKTVTNTVDASAQENDPSSSNNTMTVETVVAAP